ncbi:MAG: MFS transporter [Pseudomonadota bacterium]
MVRDGFHYGWVVVFTGLLVAIGAHGFGRMSYTLILPAMRDGLQFSYQQLGLLGTGNFIGYLLMALIGGMLAARFGTRLVIAVALLLMGVTIILTGFADTFGFAFFMRLLTGLGNGAAYVPAMALGSIWFTVHRRGFATGIVSAGIGAGTMIAGLVVPPILTTYGTNEGWRYAWFYLGPPVLVIAVIAWVLLRNRPADLGLGQVGEQGRTAPAEAPKAPVAPLSWGSVYKLERVWYLGAVYFMYGFSYIIYMTFFAAYLTKDMGIGAAETGRLWAMVGGLSIFCGVIWGGISDKLGRGRGAALAYLVLGASYLIFALVQVKTGFYISAALFGISAWSIPTIMAATAGDYVGPRLAPAGLGFITLFFGLGQALGPWVGGVLKDFTGTFTYPFFLACGVSLLGAALSLGLSRIRAD